MRKFDLILFDLGSTLLFFDTPWEDVSAVAYGALVDTLIQLGYAVPKEEFQQAFSNQMKIYYDIRSTEYVEKTTQTVVKELLEVRGYLDVEPSHLRQALDAMYAVSQSHWKREDDALPTLERLQTLGFRLGAISNAADGPDVHKLIEQNELDKYFEQVLISAEVGLRKPHPKIFQMALDYFKVSPKRTVMVGDTLEADILGAKQAGITSVWITRRVESGNSSLLGSGMRPDAVIAALDELPDLLMHWH